jgi:hypothetical protein
LCYEHNPLNRSLGALFAVLRSMPMRIYWRTQSKAAGGLGRIFFVDTQFFLYLPEPLSQDAVVGSSPEACADGRAVCTVCWKTLNAAVRVGPAWEAKPASRLSTGAVYS